MRSRRPDSRARRPSSRDGRAEPRIPTRLPRLRIVGGTTPAALLSQISAAQSAPAPPSSYLTSSPGGRVSRPCCPTPARAWRSGSARPLLTVALATVAVYALKQIAPVVSLSVVYLPAVLLVSTYWGVSLGLLTALGSRGRVQLLPPAADRPVHDRRQSQLGRAGGVRGGRADDQRGRRARARAHARGRAPARRGRPGRRAGPRVAARRRLRPRAVERRAANRRVARAAVCGDRRRPGRARRRVDAADRRSSCAAADGARIGTLLVPADLELRSVGAPARAGRADARRRWSRSPSGATRCSCSGSRPRRCAARTRSRPRCCAPSHTICARR